MARHNSASETINVGDGGGGGTESMKRTALRKIAPIHPRYAPSVGKKAARHTVSAWANREKEHAFRNKQVAAIAEQAALQKTLAQHAALNEQFQKLQPQIAELELVQRKLSAIEGSTSWRITYPLRRLGDTMSFVRSTTKEWRMGIGLPHFGKTRHKADRTVSREPASLASDRSLANLDSQKKPSARNGGANLEEAAISAAELDAQLEGAKLTDADSAQVFGGTDFFETMPLMADDELACFERLLGRANKVLEYGCGGSTIFAASLGHCHIFGVESDPAWLHKVQANPVFRDATAAGRAVLKHVNIGPTGKWGVPSDETYRHLWPRYSEFPWANQSDYDLIFVDGRFRVACVLNAVLRASSDALIVVHDFWNRPEYHVVLPFLEWKETSQTLGVFQRRREIDRASVQALIDEYQYISD